MTMEDAQKIVHDELPDAVKDSVVPETHRLQLRRLPGARRASRGRGTPHRARDRQRRRHDPARVRALQVKQPLQIFTSVIYAIALISLLVGGLSVINTMTMSVSERTREIGVRKAIGASNGQIMGQFVAESAVIGLIGGVAGMVLGLMVASVGNAAGAMSGNALFLVTNRLLRRLAALRGRPGHGERPVSGVSRGQPQPGGGAAL